MLGLQLGEGRARQLDLVHLQVGQREQEQHLGVEADPAVRLVRRLEAADRGLRVVAVEVELGDVELVLEQAATDVVLQLERVGVHRAVRVVVEEVGQLDERVLQLVLVALVVRRHQHEAVGRVHVGGDRGHVRAPAVLHVPVRRVQLVELLELVLRGRVVALRELGPGDKQLGLDGVAAEREADPHEVGVLHRLFVVLVAELADRELVVLARGLAVVRAEVRTRLAAHEAEPQGQRRAAHTPHAGARS